MRLLIVLATLALSGCSVGDLTPNRLQFSKETIPFPAHYQVEAARVVAQKRGDPSFVRVSYPRTTLGQNAFSPQRWYVCLRGLTPPEQKPGLPTVDQVIGRTFDPKNNGGIYDVLLFFSAEGALPSVRDGFDSALCRDGQFEALTAQAPAT